jgi:hypothetical protein
MSSPTSEVNSTSDAVIVPQPGCCMEITCWGRRWRAVQMNEFDPTYRCKKDIIYAFNAAGGLTAGLLTAYGYPLWGRLTLVAVLAVDVVLLRAIYGPCYESVPNPPIDV